ncbi:DNA-binding domain-containing protein [Mesobacterium sp. TK19101]|uniref:DNA-binding domain-containing protein n=1 Tax=Mesobacterium hydrothermale TaxID=3111907 RepID=A0ABU6HCS7_9RHOB|nr:DNA-binding domain-containing protein [Mesobacterium sp. TK19101]MEC3859932.1 DNA-binding domain-containing protein [Mesobacterium sp. TK19101]
MSLEPAFRAALRAPSLPVPDGLTDGLGRPAGRRYAVYRNNIAVSLREALAQAFPAVHRLIGNENFGPVARMFLSDHLPRSPLMMQYGAGFAEFLETLAPLARWGYLPDVARLEQALRLSYHAADVAPMDPARLAGLDADAVLAARVTLVPAARLVRSAWPVVSVWRYAMQAGPAPAPVAEAALILRPELDPTPHPLPEKAGAFVAALIDGQPLGDACPDDFDPTPVLTLLLRHGAIAAIS